ncbi:MAG TPA: hypothetical protein VI796_04485 [Candidatus Thermoplasmatota archaeon]|nr:hypothetical protein [Candidatus Thermoplasmatota archaeon]
MDVMDAGVYAAKFEGRVPKTAQLTLWGPLQAREMGLEGWEVQDGGETGFVFHNAGVKLTMGHATSTLIFVRRLERAFLTVYFGGYPADAPLAQRRLDMQKVVGACETFLTRLSKEPVRFQIMGEMTLVDNVNDAAVAVAALTGGRGAPRASGAVIDVDAEMGITSTTRRTGRGDIVPGEAAAEPDRKRGKSDVWEV